MRLVSVATNGKAVHITCKPSNRNSNRPASIVTSGILAGRLQNDNLIEEGSAVGLNTCGRSGKGNVKGFVR